MSSLAASRADNFYYGPDFDGKKHGSLNKYRGQHPLRERARKLDQGILIIRFEMPFHIFCDGCKNVIAKGVRFNAEKKQIGSYYSSKIWSFSMRCATCSHPIEIQTDPKNTDYIVAKGGKKKADMSTASHGEVIELMDPAEREAINANPLKKMEREAEHRHKLEEERKRIHILAQQSNERQKDDYSANKSLRRVMREQRKEAKSEEKRIRSRGLGIKLVRESETDKRMAKAMASAVAKKGIAERKRKRELEQGDIFAGTGLYGAAGKSSKAPHSSRFSGQSSINDAGSRRRVRLRR